MPNRNEDWQTPIKRRRLVGPDQDTEQEAASTGIWDQSVIARLHRILMCLLCLDLPSPKKAFQCRNNHIICEDCATRLLAHATLEGQLAECPCCRTHFNWQGLTQCFAFERLLWQLRARCPECNIQIALSNLSEHLATDCPKRLVDCKYLSLGCLWQCSFDAMVEHEVQCEFPNMHFEPVLEALNDSPNLRNRQEAIERFYELNAVRVNYLDIDMQIVNSHLIGENAELNLQSPRLQMYNQVWQLNMRLEDSSYVELGFTYSLMIMEAPQRPTHVKYFIGLLSKGLRGQQLSDIKYQINEKVYTSAGQADSFKILPISCPSANYTLIAMPVIKLRLWMMEQMN